MILDIIFIVLILISAYLGYKKGLISILMGFVSLIVAIALAFVLHNVLAEFLYNNTPMGSSIQGMVTNLIEDYVNDSQSDMTEDQNTIAFFDKIISSDQKENLVEEYSVAMTKYIIKGISFIAILILVLIIAYIITMLTNIVFNFPILNSVNKIGGIGLNVLRTIIKFWILFAIISFISTLPFMDEVIKQINGTNIVKFFYENNMLVSIIQGTIKI